MHQKFVVRHAMLVLMTWLVILSCALMAYAEGNALFNGRPPEPYTSVYAENAYTNAKAFACRADGVGLYEQLRAYYAPNEPADILVTVRLEPDSGEALELSGSGSAPGLENGQTYTVRVAIGYRAADGTIRQGPFVLQPEQMVPELYCSVTAIVTGPAEGGILLNGVPVKGSAEVYDYTDVTLEAIEVPGYTCQVLVNGTALEPAAEHLYPLGALGTETEIEIRYAHTNVQCAEPEHGAVSLVHEADCFTVTVTPDAGYAVAAVRVNGAARTETVYSGGVAQLTLDNNGGTEYWVTADIVQETIAAQPSPVVTCRAGREDALTKAQVFAAVVDPARCVPAGLTADEVEVEYQLESGWAALGESGVRLFGTNETETVRFRYLGSENEQYPPFVSEAVQVVIDRQTREVWLEQPAHAVMTGEEQPDGSILVAVAPEEGYAVAAVFVAESQGEAAAQKDIRFADGTAYLTLTRAEGTSYTVTAQTVRQRLALKASPALVLREAQGYPEETLESMVFAAAVDTAASVPTGLTAADVEIRYRAQDNAADGERLGWQPDGSNGHAFGEKSSEHIYLLYKGSPNGQYRAITQELDLVVQRTRHFTLTTEISGAAPGQGGAVLTATRGGESRVIKDGGIWEDGETVTLSVRPIAGYRYEAAVNGSAILYREDNTYILGVLEADTFIEIRYVPANLTIEDAGHAAVRTSAPDAEGCITVEADPAEGWAVTALRLNGIALPQVRWRDGIASAVLTPEQTAGQGSLTVETVEEKLAVRTTDLSGYASVTPAQLLDFLFADILDAEHCVPALSPGDISAEYYTSAEVSALGWSGELWLPVEAQPQDVLARLPADVASQLGDDLSGLRYRAFGQQASETLRLRYEGSAQYRPFTQELTLSMPDWRSASELRLTAEELSVGYGCTQQELEAQLLALVEGVFSEGEAVLYTPEDLAVELGPDCLVPGTHTAALTYRGNAQYKGASASVAVTVAAGAASIALRVPETVTHGEAYNIRVSTGVDGLCYAVVVACTKGDQLGYTCINLSDSAKAQLRVTLPGQQGTTDLYKTVLVPALQGASLPDAIAELEAFGQKYGAYLPRLELGNIIELLNEVKRRLPLVQCRVCLDDTFTQLGTYYIGAVTVDANYQKATDTAALTIQRDSSGVSLEWNNQGKALQIMSEGQAARTDFGATLYDETLKTTNKTVKNSVVTFCAGVTFDKQPFVSTVGPEDAGVYLQMAFVTNRDYDASRLFRGIVVLGT